MYVRHVLAMRVRNAGETVQELEAKLVAFTEAAKAIKAKADAEGRETNAAEDAAISAHLAEFESTTAQIDRLNFLNGDAAANLPGMRRGGADGQISDAATDAARHLPAPQPSTRPGALPAPSTETVNPRAGILLSVGEKSPSRRIFGNVGRSQWKTPDEFFNVIAHRQVDSRLAIRNAVGVEGTGDLGGFDVPAEWFTGIIDLALQAAEYAPRSRLFPSSSNNLTIPAPNTQDQSTSLAGITGNWVAEASTQTPQALVWRSIELKLNKIFILAQASNELAADGLNYRAQLDTVMSAAVAYSLDSAILGGTGTGTPLGILNSPSAIAITPISGQASNTIVYENLVDMYCRLSAASQKNSVWYISPSCLPQLLQMTFPGSTMPVLLGTGFNNAAASAPSMSIFGRPVVTTELNSGVGEPGDIVLADMSQYALLMKPAARIEYDAGPGFAADIATWRLVLRATGHPLWSDVLTPRGSGSATLTWATYLQAR